MKRGVIVVVSLALLLSSTLFATGVKEDAPSFPTKTITVICPFGAGGGTDALARKLVEIVEKQSNVKMIVENKTGGSGAVGMGVGANAKADGYTVTMTTVEVVLLPAAQLAAFQPSDFRGIIRVNFDAAALIVKSSNKANTLKDFIENAKTSSKSISVNVSAFPTNYWLAGAMLNEQSGVKFNLVEEPQGAAQQIANMLGGHVDAIICTMAEVEQYVASGDFKILAVASNERNKMFPTVPTFREEGYNIEVGTWRGFMVPKDTSDDVVAVLDSVFTKAYQSQEFQDFLAKMKFGTGYLNSDDFAHLVAEQYNQYQPVIAKYL